jgi:hypothetical protein
VILLIPSKHDAQLGFAEPLPVSFYLCLEHVDLGAFSIPSETGLLIPSDFSN